MHINMTFCLSSAFVPSLASRRELTSLEQPIDITTSLNIPRTTIQFLRLIHQHQNYQHGRLQHDDRCPSNPSNCIGGPRHFGWSSYLSLWGRAWFQESFRTCCRITFVAEICYVVFLFDSIVALFGFERGHDCNDCGRQCSECCESV